jgi:hypothetical protein
MITVTIEGLETLKNRLNSMVAYRSSFPGHFKTDIRGITGRYAAYLKEEAPRADTGQLKDAIDATSVAGGWSALISTEAGSLNYAGWVARGTLDSPVSGKFFAASDYRHKFFTVSHNTKINLWRTGDKLWGFNWRGQEASNFDIKAWRDTTNSNIIQHYISQWARGFVGGSK